MPTSQGDVRLPLRALLVQDRQIDSDLILAELRRAGFDVSHARVDDETSIRHALAQGPWDVVVCDHELPRLHSKDVCAILRSSGSDAPLIVVAGDMDAVSGANVIKYGACDLILKQDLTALAECIDREMARRRSPAALEASRNRLELLTAVIADWDVGVVVYDAEVRDDGLVRIVYANDAIERYTDLTPAELIGRSPAVFYRGAEQNAALVKVRDAVHAGIASSVRHRRDNGDGNSMWVELTTSPIRSADGSILNWISVRRDVSEQQLNKEARVATEGRLALLVRQFPALMWATDYEMRVTWTDGKALNSIGLGREDAVGMDLQTFFKDIDPKVATEQHHRAALDGMSTEYFQEWMGRLFNVHLEPIRAGDDRVSGVLGIAIDVTDQMRVEADLRKSEVSLAAAQEIAHLGNWERDLLSGATAYSEECYRILGLVPGRDPIAPSGFYDFDHPDDVDVVRRTIAESEVKHVPYSLDHRITRHNGEVRWVHEQGAYVLDKDGTALKHFGTLLDITERKHAEERLAHLAHHDALTDLPNRVMLDDRLAQSIAHAERNGRVTAVLFLDLDRFKDINDTLGHSTGDRLLKRVSERLSDCLRTGDTVARSGGDEFIIVLADVAHVDDVTVVAKRIVDSFSTPFSVDGRELYASASMGISVFPFDGRDVDSLIRFADAAMYKAKDTGRNHFQFFTADMNAKALARLTLEGDLRRAIERGQLALHYQPVLNLASGSVVGAEALLRWNHPEHGLVMPADFIPLAEETGLIVPIGEWVLNSACAQARAWDAQGHDPLRMMVNISPRQFQERNLGDVVDHALVASGLPARRLELEITESVVMRDTEEAIRSLNSLKAKGIRLSVDDFGTGYSSLGYLKLFPVDTLKIDRSFVRDISVDAFDEAIAAVIVGLARSLHLHVIAEGVETHTQLAFLRRVGCDEMQGHLFSKAVPAHEFETLLSEGRKLAASA